jgi:hypothetical protein
MIASAEGVKRPLLGNTAISDRLYALGYKGSIENLLNCGQETGFKYIKQCGCDTKIIKCLRHCNLRTCESCSKKRKRKIVNKYLPTLSSLKIDRTNFLYFLTISPKNYTDLEEGINTLKRNYKQFLKTSYISERIKGGFYVIESKGTKGNWNVHLHAIVYGRFIDNKVRTEQHSKIVRLWHRVSKNESVNMHVTRQNNTQYTLNYMCKYISSNKDDFHTLDDLAHYIHYTYKRRLITSFGQFYNIKLKVSVRKCPFCSEIIEFIFDAEVVHLLETKPDPPKTIYSYI